jgi:6-pyruvoyltetrahydropterin/6-carboxytetrahydropterin synthase
MSKYESTKTYGHNVGLSCVFRQWRAQSHCSKLHGYSISVKIVFRCRELDENGWVMDFGGLKQVKKWLEEVFDHKTLVAKDDPHMEWYQAGARRGVLDLVVLDRTGCEAFANLILTNVNGIIGTWRVWAQSVEVSEHEGNSAIAYIDDARRE